MTKELQTARSNITVAGAMLARAAAEAEIQEVLLRLQRDTGLCPMHITLKTAVVAHIDADRNEYLTTGVTIHLEPI